MRSFSERYGYTPVRESIQIQEIEEKTRIRLWNILGIYFFNDDYNTPTVYSIGEGDDFLNYLWHDFFELPLSDLFDMKPYQVYSKFRDLMLQYNWFSVYDFVEAVLKFKLSSEDCTKFTEQFNLVLEKDICGYRIISGFITPIITPTEIAEIEEALQQPFDTVNKHLNTALELFSDRMTSNYPNSVKESISAVEGICKIILSEKNITLGAALRSMENSGISFHGAFKSGLNSIYGWTSSDAGIRHARIDDSDIGSDEAKFMIVLCSAFINFLVAKAEKAGINLMTNYNAITEN